MKLAWPSSSRIGAFIITLGLVVGDAGAAVSMANNDGPSVTLFLLFACGCMILGGAIASMERPII